MSVILQKTVKPVKSFVVGAESVSFLEDGRVLTCFDGQTDVLSVEDGFFDFVVKVAPYYYPVNHWHGICHCFDVVESFNKNQNTLFSYMLDNYNYYNELERIVKFVAEDAYIFEGRASDYALQLVNDCYDLDKMLGNLSGYFNYNALARDLETAGDIVEIGHNLFWANPHDF